MQHEFEITTIYLNPSERIGYTGDTSNLLSQEASEWLKANVGSQAKSYRDLVFGLQEGSYDWSFNGRVYIPQTNYTKIGYSFSFVDDKKALMFKLFFSE